LNVIALVLVAISPVAPNCVPDQPNFYWQTPCNGQKFDNLITATSLKMSQNGQDIDVAGGVDLTADLDIQVDFVNTYGAIQKPLVDAKLQVYSKVLEKCKWVDIPTLGFTTNVDACLFTPECHLNNSETSLAITVYAKDIPAALLAPIIVGDYYSAAITFKDSKTDLSCVYGQDKIIKK